MKAVNELNHYELLEIEPDASASDVERAYRIACAAYAKESLAVYSVYAEAEAEAIRERIDEAYLVLANPEARSEYDARLPAPAEPVRQPAEIPLAFEPDQAAAEPPALLELDEEGDGPFDGPRLRRSRLHRGIEIDHVANVTKISPSYLQFIEDERFEDLPAPVYVRGFVSAYARCMGLDAERVAGSYMARFRAAQVPQAARGRRVR